MRIAIVCRESLYHRISESINELDIDYSPPLFSWDDFIEWIQDGETDGILIEDGIPFADRVKSMPIPHFSYENRKDFSTRIREWVAAFRLPPKKQVTEDTSFWEDEEPSDKAEELNHSIEQEQVPSQKEKESPVKSYPLYYRLRANQQQKETQQEEKKEPKSPLGHVEEDIKNVGSNRQEIPQMVRQPIEETETEAYSHHSRPFRSSSTLGEDISSNEPPVTTNKDSIYVNEQALKSPSVLHPETITVFSGKGGVGVTTITIHLAEVYNRAGVKTGVIDLGFPYGHISSYLNIAPSSIASDIQKSSFYFSEVDWHQMTVQHKGLRYYLPPNQWPLDFRYDEGMMDKLIRNMQRSTTVVLCDMNSQHSLASQLMAFSLSTKIYWILDLNRATIYHTRRQLVQLKEHGFVDLNKIQYILNRVSDKSLDIGLIEETLEGKVILNIPESPEISKSMNQGGIGYKSPLMDGLELLIGTAKGSGGKLSRFLKGIVPS